MTLQKLPLLKSSALLFATMALFSCKKEEGDGNKSNLDVAQLNNYVKNLPSVAQMAPFPERLASSSAGRPVSLLDGATFASDLKYEQAKEHENQLLFAENEEIFYPGALVKAKTVVDGSYLSILAPRNPITISTSLTGEGARGIEVKNPSLSTVRTAINELLNRGFNPPPANITFDSYEVHDEQHLKMALGASYSGAVNTIKGNVGFDYKKERTRYIVKIEQVFYTVDVDTPQNASDFFSKDFNYKELFGAEKPVYISSIKYGRVLLLGIESTLSKVELEAKLNGSFLKGKLTAEAETNFEQLSKTSSIRGRVFGGSGELAGKVIGDFTAVREFMEKGGNFSKENLGVPLSYRLRELGSNKIFKTVIYSKYTKNDSGSLNSKKLNFELAIRDNGLKDPYDNIVIPKHFVIERLNAQGGSYGSKPEYYQDKKISKHFSAFEKGEKIRVTAVLKDNKGTLIFDLPSFEELIYTAQNTKPGENMYDLEKGKGRQLKDRDQKYILTFGIYQQKITN